MWEQDVQTVALSGPITYTLDGEQYVAVAAGWGGGMANFSNVLSESDADAVHAYVIERANADWDR